MSSVCESGGLDQRAGKAGYIQAKSSEKVPMSSLCFYCQGAEPLPHERFCTSCRNELLTNRGKYLKRLIVDAEERMADFKVLSKDAAKYRISKENAMSNEYAMKRFGELVQTMKDRIGILWKELQVGDEGRE